RFASQWPRLRELLTVFDAQWADDEALQEGRELPAPGNRSLAKPAGSNPRDESLSSKEEGEAAGCAPPPAERRPPAVLETLETLHRHPLLVTAPPDDWSENARLLAIRKLWWCLIGIADLTAAFYADSS